MILATHSTTGGYFDGRNSDNLRFAESQPVTMTYHPDVRDDTHNTMVNTTTPHRAAST